jgi:hypothetical protein
MIADYHTHYSPVLRSAARWHSNIAGSLIGMRYLYTSSVKCGWSRSTSAAAARASTSRLR